MLKNVLYGAKGFIFFLIFFQPQISLSDEPVVTLVDAEKIFLNLEQEIISEFEPNNL